MNRLNKNTLKFETKLETKKMASNYELKYVKNNKGRNDIFYNGYIYSQKTNLKTAGDYYI